MHDELTIRRLGRPGDLGWVIMAHGEVYATEFGWDATLEAFIMQIVAAYAAAHDPAGSRPRRPPPRHRARFRARERIRPARLWTNHPLAAGRHLYLQRGFTLVEEHKHHRFGVDLVGQVYELPLTAGT